VVRIDEKDMYRYIGYYCTDEPITTLTIRETATELGLFQLCAFVFSWKISRATGETTCNLERKLGDSLNRVHTLS